MAQWALSQQILRLGVTSSGDTDRKVRFNVQFQLSSPLQIVSLHVQWVFQRGQRANACPHACLFAVLFEQIN